MNNNLLRLIVILTVLVLPPGVNLWSQTTAPQAPQAPTAPTTPTTPSGPTSSAAGQSTTSSTSSPASSSTKSGIGNYEGTWNVTRAIYDYLGTLKDVSAKEGNYYRKLTIGANGKGALVYMGKTEAVEIEYEFRDQGLTIAYGSRLKPSTDGFQILPLADGTLFLKSRRLGNMNGTMIYILARE